MTDNPGVDEVSRAAAFQVEGGMIDFLLLGRIFVLGAVAGLRSILPLALLAWLAPPVPWLATFVARWLFGLAAAVELVTDKLPRTPSRLNPGPLFGRLALGGLVGGLSAVPTETPVWLGALVGTLASAAGSFGGNKLRALLVRKSGKPDLWIALLEDAIAMGAATWALLGPLGPAKVTVGGAPDPAGRDPVTDNSDTRGGLGTFVRHLASPPL